MRYNLKHNNFLMSTMQHNRNFNIWVNWVKIIAFQIGLPRIMCKFQKHENSKLPTLKGSKPSQTNSK